MVHAEDAKKDYFKPLQKKFKQATQDLINLFVKESDKVDIEVLRRKECIFELYHIDYKGLELIKENRRFLLILKKYPTYIYRLKSLG